MSATPIISTVNGLQTHVKKFTDQGTWAIIAVTQGLSEDQVPFAYTVGLTALGLPELLVSGEFPSNVLHMLLNGLGEHCKRAQDACLGVNTELFGGPVLLKEVTSKYVKDEFVFQAVLKYGESVRVTQVIWSDAGGHFPSSPEYNARDLQELF